MDRSATFVHDVRDLLTTGMDASLLGLISVAFLLYFVWLFRYIRRHR